MIPLLKIACRAWPGRTQLPSWQPELFPAWRDTVNIPGKEKIKIAVPFRHFTGKTVFHCHISEHEDKGMMGVIQVKA